jgi:hypothetical protein
LAEQIAKRARGERIEDRLVSTADPDARLIRKGKLGKPTQCGYVWRAGRRNRRRAPPRVGRV